MQTDDERMIYKCLNGEPEAFGFLVDKYRESVYALAFSKLRNFHDAEDITQEAFIKAYRKLHTLRRWDDFLSWLYAITSNLCKNWVRANSKRPDKNLIDDDNPGILENHSLDSYQRNLMSESLQESLEEALESLPEIYRQVIVLRYMGNMNSFEIAKFLGMAPGSVRERLSRARTMLKEEMLEMIGATFETNKLKAGFTFKIVETVKQIRIYPNPITKGLPFGLSLATGIILAILSIGSQINLSSSLPEMVESLISGREYPVTIGDFIQFKSFSHQTNFGSGNNGNGNGIMLASSQDQNLPAMALGEGGKIPDKPSVQLGKGRLGKMAYSPDGKMLAVSTAFGVKLYDADNFNEIDMLPKDSSSSYSPAFSPDGKTLATAGKDKIGLWDMQTRKQIGSLPSQSQPHYMAFSPNGKILASTIYEDNMIRLWDVEKLQQAGMLGGHTDYIVSILFSSDGKLISCSSDKTIRIWDIQNQKQIGLLEGHKNRVWAIALSSDGKILASGDMEGELLLWNIQEQKLIGSLEGHKPWVSSLAFSPDGKILASGSTGDQAIRIWDIQARRQVALIQGNRGEASQVCFNASGGILASMNYADPAIRFWDIKDQKQVGIIEEFTNSGYSLAFSPDGKTLASGESGGFVRLWDIQEQKSVGRLEGYYGYWAGLNTIAFSPDGKIIASINNDSNNNKYEIYLFDVQKQERIGAFKGHSTAISSIAFTPDGKILVSSGNQERTVRLWDVDKQKELGVLFNNSWVHTVAISPDGETIAAAVGDERLIRLWDTSTQKEIGVLNDPAIAAFSVAFSPDGKTLVSCNQLGIIRIWNYKERKLIDEFQGPKPYGITIFSPDGKWLITISGNVQFWDVQTQKEIATTQEQFHNVYAVAFSPGGKWMATASWDGTIQLWEVNISVQGKSVDPMGKAIGTWGDIKKSQLLQNFPNPFNPETWIPFSLSDPEHVIIKIYDSAGKLVRKLDLGNKEPGEYISREKSAYWDGKDENGEQVASNTYFTVMEAGNFKDVKKIVMAK